MKKYVAWVMLLLLLCGCGKKTEVTDSVPRLAKQRESVFLTVRVSGEEKALTEQMAAAFAAQFPETDMQIAVEDSAAEKSGNGADVFPVAQADFSDLMTAHALQPVVLNGEMVTVENSTVLPALWDNMLYAYPQSVSGGSILCYDSRFFSEEDVRSLNKMAEKSAENGKYMGIDMEKSGFLYMFFSGAGLEIGADMPCKWNTPAAESVCNSLLELFSTGAFLTEHIAEEAETGEIVAVIGGAEDAKLLRRAFDTGFACTKLPTFFCDGKQVQMGSMAHFRMLGVNPFSEQVGYALLLAQYLTNEENQLLRYESLGEIPTNLTAGSGLPEVAAALTAQSAFSRIEKLPENYVKPMDELCEKLLRGNPDGTDPAVLVEILTAQINGDT